MSAVVLPPKKPARKRSGTAKWHMSREAVNLPLEEIYAMDEEACWQFFVEARFGSRDTVRCPNCGSIGKHYFRSHDKRWKCHGCKSTFSVTSGTVFAQHKISLRKLLLGALTWVNSSAGQPALEAKRHVDTTYNTVFTLQHKLREALMRGYNVGLLNCDVEIDGAYQAGFKADEKRGKPKGGASGVAAPVHRGGHQREGKASDPVCANEGTQAQEERKSNGGHGSRPCRAPLRAHAHAHLRA